MRPVGSPTLEDPRLQVHIDTRRRGGSHGSGQVVGNIALRVAPFSGKVYVWVPRSTDRLIVELSWLLGTSRAYACPGARLLSVVGAAP